MGLPGTSVLAAAATYAGLQVRGTLRELRARLQPWETAAALEQEVALDTAGMALVPRMLDQTGRAEVAEETVRLARRTMARFAEAAPVSGALQADLRDDELLGHEEAAELILGLQDRTTRDRAAEWMEAEEAGPALRLWRALARRCVGPYGEHAAAPLTLAGWVAWAAGDEIEAREALAMALGADPGYLFARLLHQACNEGLDPESIRRCLRAEREGREARARAEIVPPTEVDDVETTDGLMRPTRPFLVRWQPGPVPTGASARQACARQARRHAVRIPVPRRRCAAAGVRPVPTAALPAPPPPPPPADVSVCVPALAPKAHPYAAEADGRQPFVRRNPARALDRPAVRVPVPSAAPRARATYADPRAHGPGVPPRRRDERPLEGVARGWSRLRRRVAGSELGAAAVRLLDTGLLGGGDHGPRPAGQGADRAARPAARQPGHGLGLGLRGLGAKESRLQPVRPPQRRGARPRDGDRRRRPGRRRATRRRAPRLPGAFWPRRRPSVTASRRCTPGSSAPTAALRFPTRRPAVPPRPSRRRASCC